MQASQIPGDELANRAESTGQFFIVFEKIELNPRRSLVPGLCGKPHEMCYQARSDRRKRQILNQAYQMTQSMSKDFEDFERKFWILQTDSSEIIGRQS